jgi:hypothetical protein
MRGEPETLPGKSPATIRSPRGSIVARRQSAQRIAVNLTLSPEAHHIFTRAAEHRLLSLD